MHSSSLTAAQERLLASVGTYYTEKILQHGATPLGVDWSFVPTQEMRFVQLLKVCDFSRNFSLNDVGCGYGALLHYLMKRHRRRRIEYFGTDISAEMVAAATGQWSGQRLASFSVARNAQQLADYSVASGTFNVKLQISEENWELMICDALECMNAMSMKGFAVNFLSPPVRAEFRIPELYYASPDAWSDYCKEKFNADVEILSGYGLRENTLLVRRRG